MLPLENRSCQQEPHRVLLVIEGELQVNKLQVQPVQESLQHAQAELLGAILSEEGGVDA